MYLAPLSPPPPPPPHEYAFFLRKRKRLRNRGVNTWMISKGKSEGVKKVKRIERDGECFQVDLRYLCMEWMDGPMDGLYRSGE